MLIGICDSQPREREDLRKKLLDYLRQAKLAGTILAYSSSSDLLSTARESAFDVLFLETVFPESTGLSAAWTIRRLLPKCHIIFHTHSRAYALEAFDIGAVHYLLKSVSPKKLSEAMARCVHEAAAQKSGFLEIIVARTKIQIRQEHIHYLESFGKQTCIHTGFRDYFTWNSITHIEQLLNPQSFLRIQRSYLIHMGFIQYLTGKTCTLVDGTVLSVSRKYCGPVKAKYAAYLRAGLGTP